MVFGTRTQQGAMGGADSAGMLAEFSFDDADASAARTPFEAVEAFVEWIKEGWAGIRDATANHNDFRIEDVDEAGEGCGESVNGSEPGIGGFGRALLERPDQIAGGFEAAIGTLDDIVLANSVLEAAWGTDDVEGAIGIERDVAQMTCASKPAAKDMAIDHGGTSDACPQREQDYTAGGPCRAAPNFGEQGCLRIIEHRNGIGSAKPLLPVKLLDARKAIRQRGDAMVVG